MTFVSLVLIQFFKAYNFRSDRHSVLVRPFANKWLNLAIAWELVALALVIYVPDAQRAVRDLPAAAARLDHRRDGRGHGVPGAGSSRSGWSGGAGSAVSRESADRGGTPCRSWI